MNRRTLLLVAAAVVIAAGLTVHVAVQGVWGGVAGDILYAAMAYLLVAAVVPRARRLIPAVIALALCFGIEVLQLAGPPPALALVLGSTFQWGDLLAYTVGVGAAAGVDALVVRRGAGSSRDATTTPSADAPASRPPAGTRSR